MLETLCMVGNPPAPANDQQIQACRAGARYDEREVLSMYAEFTASVELLKQQTPSAPAEAKLADFSAKRVGVVDRIHEQMQQMNLKNDAVWLLFKVDSQVSNKELSTLATRFLEDFVAACIETSSPAPSPLADPYASEGGFQSEASNASVVMIGVGPTGSVPSQ